MVEGPQAARRPSHRDPKAVLQEGAQIVADPNEPKPMTMLGHVTSSYWSDALGRSIAMAVVVDGHDREGETLHILDADLAAWRRQEHGLRPRGTGSAPEDGEQNERDERPFAAGVTIATAPTTRTAPARRSRGRRPRVSDRDRRAHHGGARTALCLGPDEWLIEAPEVDAAAPDRLADLATRQLPKCRRGLRPRDHPRARRPRRSRPARHRLPATSRGCPSATAPARSSTTPKSC